MRDFTPQANEFRKTLDDLSEQGLIEITEYIGDSEAEALADCGFYGLAQDRLMDLFIAESEDGRYEMQELANGMELQTEAEAK